MAKQLENGHVVIKSKNLQHTIKAEIVPEGEVDIEVTESAVDCSVGTRIKLTLPLQEAVRE